jgi:hypothetical protein
MRECRRRVDLDALPPFPAQPVESPCLHFIAAWGRERAPMAEAVLFALTLNRELVIRNIRPAEVPHDWIEPVRGELEAAAKQFAHEVPAPDYQEGALFGDQHERNHVARVFATLLLGPDAMVR